MALDTASNDRLDGEGPALPREEGFARRQDVEGGEHSRGATGQAVGVDREHEEACGAGAPVHAGTVLPMKVLFLDIDGVLNKAPDYLVRFPDQRTPYLINQKLLDRLKKVLEDTGAKVVLSSSWRVMQGGRDFVEECGIQILDITDNGPGKRGDQIKRWLDAHPEVETYAIIDDDSDMLDEQLPHFVLTEFVTGLTEQAAYRLTYKLGGEIPLGVSR